MALCRALQQLLSDERARFEVLPHAQVFTAQEVAATSHVPGWRLAKVVVLRDDAGESVMAALPAPARLDLDALEQLSGRRLRLAREDEFRLLFTDCEAGAMPPFGALYGMPLYLDRSLADGQEFLFQAGNHKEVVRMRYDEYARLARPIVGEFCTPEQARKVSL